MGLQFTVTREPGKPGTFRSHHLYSQSSWHLLVREEQVARGERSGCDSCRVGTIRLEIGAKTRLILIE
jgi:hypothetical protein